MRIAFRTDASDLIGTGHLMRTLALADALAAAGHTCRFVLREHSGTPAGLVAARGHALSLLPPPDGSADSDLAHAAWLGVSQARDAADTRAALTDGCDWLVADHYALDHRWETALRPAANRIMAIDDLADRRHDCDLLLDQNPQAAPDRYAGLLPAGATALVGPRHALLRDEFVSLRTADRAARGPLLVYFGGVDADGATMLALRGIEQAGLAAGGVTVVAGARNPHLAAIRTWVDRHTAAVLHEGNAPLAELIAGARIGLGAAGATALERCCLALPSIVLTIAANQRPGAAALAAMPAALWLGDAAECTPERIAAALVTLDRAPELAAAMGRTGAVLVDGQGTARVVRALTSAGVVLRPATESDCDTIWRWRNDPATRSQSLGADTIPLAAHGEWYAAALANPDRRIFLGESGGAGIGVVRFDRVGDTALVSIFLAPERIGEGYGSALLAAGCDAIAHAWPDLAAIEADVLAANPASQAIFARAGFRPLHARLRRDLSRPAGSLWEAQ